MDSLPGYEAGYESAWDASNGFLLDDFLVPDEDKKQANKNRRRVKAEASVYELIKHPA